jgi:hypothetical protein
MSVRETLPPSFIAFNFMAALSKWEEIKKDKRHKFTPFGGSAERPPTPLQWDARLPLCN